MSDEQAKSQAAAQAKSKDVQAEHKQDADLQYDNQDLEALEGKNGSEAPATSSSD